MTVSGFDQIVESFRATGLSQRAATFAAIGRDYRSEAEARAAWDANDRLREAEAAANATAAVRATSPGAEPALAAETVAVVEAAKKVLGMDATSARQYAVQLREREVRKGGSEYAARFQREFANALTPKAAA